MKKHCAVFIRLQQLLTEQHGSNILFNVTRVAKVVTVLCPSPHTCSILNWRCVGKEVR